MTNHLVIGQLHHIIKVSIFIVPADMQYIDQPFMPAGNCLVMPDAVQFALVWPRIFKERALHNLHRPPSTQHAAGQPNLPIATPGDLDHQLIIGNVK